MRKLADPLEWEREAVFCWRLSAASFSSAGNGRKRGPTLLEIHNENSEATTTAARKIESLDVIDWAIDCGGNLTRNVFKRPKLTELGGVLI